MIPFSITANKLLHFLIVAVMSFDIHRPVPPETVLSVSGTDILPSRFRIDYEIYGINRR